jgi:hypothetical protein
MTESQQLSVKVEGGRLVISIDVALLAFAVQNGPKWPGDYHVPDVAEFAKEMARQLQKEEEDGTTIVHRMFDTAADEILEWGGDGVEYGNVDKGIALAQIAMAAALGAK